MKHKSVLRYRSTLLLLGVSVVVVMGCRAVQERSALAQVSAHGSVAVSTAEAAPSGRPAVTVRRLWAGGYQDFYASSISPDGRYLSMIDWSTVDLAVRDLQTEKLHRLTNVQRGEGKPYEDAGVSVFSRDGRKIVVGWQYEPDLQLRVLDFAVDDAGTPRPAEARVIFHNSEYYPYYPFDWSPDGSQILAKVYTPPPFVTSQLALISVNDGTYLSLKSFDWREPTMAEFSPDGKYVAYDFPPDVDSPNRDVFVLSVDGTRDAPVLEGPASDRLLGWLPDGSILFHSDRESTPGVWHLPVSDGRASGQPELVKADMWGVEPLGFAGSRFYYGVTVNPERLYIATADLAAGRLTSPPVAVADPARVQIRGWDWSPDGRFLAYSATTPGTAGSVIGICGVDGKEVRSIRLDLGRTRRIQWHPDGRSLVAFTRDAKGRRGFYRVDLASGAYSTILVTDGTEYDTGRGNFALSPDGQTLYFGRKDPRPVFGHPELIAFDLEFGTARHVADVSAKSWSPVAISPDGSRLAVAYPGARAEEEVVGTISVTGGPFTPLDTIPQGVRLHRIGWTPDNRWIYWTTFRPQADGEIRMRIVPAEGGKSREVQLPDVINGVVRVHPDGRRIAFMAGNPRGEVWVMEGLGHDVSPTATGGPQ